MSARLVWFVAGTAAGVYGSVKAKRAAYRASMPGLIDQAAALGTGVRAFRAELAEGKHSKEHQLRTHLLASDPDLRLALPEPSVPSEPKELP
ncbi:hypothetical protein AFL01nite_03820 [Aeromicrobium flavum]|uniref:Uncharacterized protein n=1 Tax=Aeromicrobium flavum TaxID=416568 RepID=A0A512HRH4_9ACTN|nr:DUF6167 family protein [Aeromicrobium flavum]GEO88055.1 hypothetical protein AFL01nite_03820 [Aeromicrobium flavum]